MQKFEISDKVPRILIAKVHNGFLVGIFPENKELAKLLQQYVKQIMDTMNNFGGDDWKTAMQDQIDAAIGKNADDSVRLYICKDAIEVMSYIAPMPAGDKPKEKHPDLSGFWY